MQDKPPVLPADFFDAQEPPPVLPADFFDKPQQSKKTRQPDPKITQVQESMRRLFQSAGMGAPVKKVKPMPGYENPFAMDREATRQKVFQKIHPGQEVVPLSEQGAKVKKPATMKNMLADVNESTELLGKNIKAIPGMAHVDALVRARNPDIPIAPSDVAAGAIMGPLNTAADVGNFLDTGELEALGNVVRDMGLPPGVLKAGGVAVKKAAQLLKLGKRADAEKVLKNGVSNDLQPSKPASTGNVEAKEPRVKPPSAAQTGQPITVKVHHGSPDARFAEEFDPNKKGYYPGDREALPDNTEFEKVHGGIRQGFKETEGGIFFSDDSRVASSYADPQRAFDYQNSVPMVLERHVTLKNPKVIDWGGKPWRGTEEAIALAKAEGHDGIIIKNVQDVYSTLEGKGKKYNKPANNVVVFDPKAISKGAPPTTPPPPPIKTGAAPVSKDPTSIALRESDRYDMRPDEPDPQTVIQWSENARKAGYGTPEGTRSILDKAKGGAEPSAEETIGLSTRLADLHRQMRGLGRKSPEYKALFDEATEIRSVRHTETARALASRAVLMDTDYSVEGIVASVETRTGKAVSEAQAAKYEKMASDYDAAKIKISELEKELEAARSAPDNTAKSGGSVWGKGTPTERMDAAKKELSELLGKMSANVDPAVVKPIAKLVKAWIDKTGGNVDLALKNAKNELKVGFGLDHTTDELWDAFKGVRPKRNVTEDLIRQRRESNRIAAAIRNKIADDERSFGGKFARKAAQASTEIKMWNPVARAIDQASNIDEVISTSFSSQFERPIANMVLKLTKNDARYKMVGMHERSEMIGRYIAEVKSNVKEAAGMAEGRWQGGGPAGHFAGILDAPARAWHEITWAGERASHLQSKYPGRFGDILDQIRDPELAGPLKSKEALKLHRDMRDFGDVQMLTNSNWASRLRGMTHGYVNNFVPAPAQPFAHFLVDMTTQFSKVLVNVADKTGQYANPFYAVGRAAFELMPMKSAVSAEVRAKTFAQIVRRGGVGAGLTHLGYVMYNEGVKVPELIGPAIVETKAKDGDRTGQYYQDDGYLAQIGRMSAALMLGYRKAQIDASNISEKQKAKLHKDLLFAPVTDNPVASNMGRWAKLFESRNPQPEQTLFSWLAGLYWPGGANEWAKVQDKQEGVFGRRAEGLIQEYQKRTPTVGGKPPKLPSKTASVRR